MVRACQQHSVSALDHFHGHTNARTKGIRGFGYLANDLRCCFRVGARTQMNTVINDFRLEVIGVHQRSVVGKRNKHFIDCRDMGLCRFPRIDTAARGVANMANSQIALQRRKVAFGKCLGHQAQILGSHDGGTIANGNAGRFLPTVLQRLQTEAGHARYIFTRCVNAKDTALFFHSVGALSGKHRHAHLCSLLIFAIHDRVLT